jgi:hypothetical protein
VETANMVSKRSVERINLAHDSFWNPVANGAGMNLTAGAVPANRATDVSAAGVGVNLLKQAYDAANELSQSFSWDTLIAVVVPMIAKIVDLHNELGLFQKTQPGKA